MHQKSLQHHVWYVGYAFSDRTNVVCERFLVFLIVAGLGSVEVSWAGENAGNTHSKKSIARLLRVRVCCFCFNWCDVHVRSIWLGPRRQLVPGYICSFMATTGEGVYHHGMKNMIPGPVILRNRSFQVEDFIFVHFTRHTFQVANTLDLAFWKQIPPRITLSPWWTHLSMPISCDMRLVLGRSSDFWLQDWMPSFQAILVHGRKPVFYPWFVSMVLNPQQQFFVSMQHCLD